MRLQITRSANAECFFIVKSIRKNGRNTNQVVERLGNLAQVRERAGNQDHYEWAKEYAAQLTLEEQNQSRQVIHMFSQSELIPKDEELCFNGGYLFLQKIYSELKVKDICKAIGRRRDYEYDLNSILSRLVYCRIINPLSKAGIKPAHAGGEGNGQGLEHKHRGGKTNGGGAAEAAEQPVIQEHHGDFHDGGEAALEGSVRCAQTGCHHLGSVRGQRAGDGRHGQVTLLHRQGSRRAPDRPGSVPPAG